jgi:hypothetical protein
MAQHYPEVSELLERFRKVAPQLPGNIPSELAFFTRMFSEWKTNPPKRKGMLRGLIVLVSGDSI